MAITAALIGGGAALAGGMLSGNAARDAAQTSANAQLQAANIAAEAQKFRPVGITSRFGTSNFGFDENGYLTSAGYTPSGELSGYQDFLSSQAPQAQQDVSGLLSLGRGYIGEDPNAVKQRYIQQQRALLAPENEQALAGIRNNLFQTGRQGLATGATTAGGLAATNPEMAAYYNSLAQQQAQIAAGADTAAQNQIKFGQGLAAGAYEPFKAGFGAMGTVEQAGQQALGLGSELGGQASSAARAMSDYQYQANAYNPTANLLANPQLQGALGSSIAGLFSNNAVPSWATGSDVLPTSTFSGSGDASWMSDYWM